MLTHQVRQTNSPVLSKQSLKPLPADPQRVGNLAMLNSGLNEDLINGLPRSEAKQLYGTLDPPSINRYD